MRFFKKYSVWFAMLLKLLVIVLMIVGVVMTAKGSMGIDEGEGTSEESFMSSAALLFFTVQSNITIGIICAVFLVFDVIGIVKKQTLVVPKWLYVTKYAFTVAITLTFLVFWLMLAPPMVKGGMANYMSSASNLCCHTFVPIFAITDWLLFDGDYRNKKYDFLWGAVMPLYYFVFAMICSAVGVDFGGGARVPYPFLDYFANGWFRIGGGGIGVFWWFWIIVVLVLGIGLALMYGKNKFYQVRLKSEMNLPADDVVTEEYREKNDKNGNKD